MRIAVFDYFVTSTNPMGSCHLRMIEGLCRQHEITVFATEFEGEGRLPVRFVRVPAPRRPLVALGGAYHLAAPWRYRGRARKDATDFDILQSVGGNILFGSVVYAHFCHRAYLRNHWRETRPDGLRRWARWADHRLHALTESVALHRAGTVVVPSQGLARELAATYPDAVTGKVRVIPNPVDHAAFGRPPAFSSREAREENGFSQDDLVLVFVALGHFERKGLPILLEALRLVRNERAKLLVVGGEGETIREYRARADRAGVGDRVRFVGMQRDVRPYLWQADAFAFPTAYEVFPLVSLQAAAAGLPLISTRVYGVEEILEDGRNGWEIERTAESVAAKIELALSDRQRLRRMGAAAVRSVEGYGVDAFVERWRALYDELGSGAVAGS